MSLPGANVPETFLHHPEVSKVCKTRTLLRAGCPTNLNLDSESKTPSIPEVLRADESSRFSGLREPGWSSLGWFLRLVFEETRHHHLNRTIPTATLGGAIIRLWRRSDPEHQDLRLDPRCTKVLEEQQP